MQRKLAIRIHDTDIRLFPIIHTQFETCVYKGEADHRCDSNIAQGIRDCNKAYVNYLVHLSEFVEDRMLADLAFGLLCEEHRGEIPMIRACLAEALNAFTRLDASQAPSIQMHQDPIVAPTILPTTPSAHHRGDSLSSTSTGTSIEPLATHSRSSSASPTSVSSPSSLTCSASSPSPIALLSVSLNISSSTSSTSPSQSHSPTCSSAPRSTSVLSTATFLATSSVSSLTLSSPTASQLAFSIIDLVPHSVFAHCKPSLFVVGLIGVITHSLFIRRKPALLLSTSSLTPSSPALSDTFSPLPSLPSLPPDSPTPSLSSDTDASSPPTSTAHPQNRNGSSIHSIPSDDDDDLNSDSVPAAECGPQDRSSLRPGEQDESADASRSDDNSSHDQPRVIPTSDVQHRWNTSSSAESSFSAVSEIELGLHRQSPSPSEKFCRTPGSGDNHFSVDSISDVTLGERHRSNSSDFLKSLGVSSNTPCSGDNCTYDSPQFSSISDIKVHQHYPSSPPPFQFKTTTDFGNRSSDDHSHPTSISTSIPKLGRRSRSPLPPYNGPDTNNNSDYKKTSSTSTAGDRDLDSSDVSSSPVEDHLDDGLYSDEDGSLASLSNDEFVTFARMLGRNYRLPAFPKVTSSRPLQLAQPCRIAAQHLSLCSPSPLV